MRRFVSCSALVCAVTLSACADNPTPADALKAPAEPTLTQSSGGPITVNNVVNVTDDTTAQNETPLAVNPTNSQNIITGNNDWNYNDGCAVSATFDGGKSWTHTLPNGFLPGVTKFTNDPNVPGTGAYDAGGDPAVAFGPDGTAYFV